MSIVRMDLFVIMTFVFVGAIEQPFCNMAKVKLLSLPFFCSDSQNKFMVNIEDLRRVKK